MMSSVLLWLEKDKVSNIPDCEKSHNLNSVLHFLNLIYHCVAIYVKIPIELNIYFRFVSGEIFKIFTFQVHKLAAT